MLYYYPNRPILIPPDPKDPLNPKPDYINSLEATGRYVAEQKWNGDNALVYTDDMAIWNRQRERHRYVPTAEVKEELDRFPKGSILNSELVHYKTKTVKNLFIVHCLLAWKGALLVGKTWDDSRQILEDFYRSISEMTHVILSPVWKSGFWKLFQEADGDIIEGIILKDPKGKLVISASKIPDVPWMMKIRKPCKKYKF